MFIMGNSWDQYLWKEGKENKIEQIGKLTVMQAPQQSQVSILQGRFGVKITHQNCPTEMEQAFLNFYI